VRDYRDAQLAARRLVRQLDAVALRRVAESLRVYGATLERRLSLLTGTGAESQAEAVRIVRGSAQELERVLATTTDAGTRASFRDVLAIWQRAGEEVAAKLGTTPGVGTGNLTSAQAFAELRPSDTWRTILSDRVRLAAREAEGILLEGLIADVSPETLARRLRPYVEGSAEVRQVLRELPTRDGGTATLDLRRVPPEARGAARQMRYNAERIAFSEVHNARAEAERRHFLADDAIVATRWELAPDRGTQTVPDVCDILARGDFYGWGPGIYPVAKTPTSPHPFDRCERFPLVREELRSGVDLTTDTRRRAPSASMLGPSFGLTPAARARAVAMASRVLL
jgi:hypothetical protein